MKKGIITLLIIFSTLTLFSQNKQQEVRNNRFGPYVTNKFFDNWFISIGAGAQIFIGEYDRNLTDSKRISTAMDASIGKWFTPTFGMRLQYSGIKAKGYGTATAPFIEGTPNSNGLYDEKFDINTLHLDLMWNFSNQVAGYKEDRVYELIPFFGVGLAHASKKNVSYTREELAFCVGVNNKFRLTSALDLNVEFKGLVLHEMFQGTTGGLRGNGLVSSTIGLTYKFKKRNFDRYVAPVIPDYTPYNNTISKLEKICDSLDNKNNIALKSKNSMKSQQEVRIVTTNVYVPSLAVFFDRGRAELNEKELINLANMAVVIKKAGDKKYKIFGSADNQTGSKKLNKKLSEKRAQTVYDTLVNKFGVNPLQLEIVTKDEQFQPFEKPILNRVSIIEN